MKPIKAVIFDMDGLMLDTERIVQKAWEAAAADCGVSFTAQDFMRFLGRNQRDSRQMLCEMFGEKFDIEHFLARARGHYDKLVTERPPPVKAGLVELLAYLEIQQMPRAVATSTQGPSARFILSKTGLLPRFNAIVTGDEVEHGKPAPDIFLKAARLLGAAPADCLVLEDSGAGVCAGAAAGMTVFMVPDMLAPTEETRRLAHGVFNSLHEVLAAINHNPNPPQP